MKFSFFLFIFFTNITIFIAQEEEVVPLIDDSKLFNGKNIDKMLCNNFGRIQIVNERGFKLYGIIDKNGKQILPPIFSFIERERNFIVVKLGAVATLYDLKMKQVLPPEYSSFEFLNDSMIIAKNLINESKLFNKIGNVLLNIEGVSNLHLFNLYIPDLPEKYLILEKDDGQKAIYDFVKKKIIRDFEYSYYDKAGEGNVILFSKFTKNHIKLIHEQLLDENFKPLTDKKYKSLKFVYPKYFIANLNEKFGLIDSKENTIIPFEYDYMQSLDNGKKSRDFFVKKNNKYGVVNSDLTQTIPVNYDSLIIFNIYKNIFVSLKNGKYGAVSEKGEEIVKIDNDDYSSFFSNKLVFTKGDSVYSYSLEGKREKSFAIKDIVINTKSKFVLVKNKQGKYGVLNEHLEELIPLEFDKIDYLDHSYQKFIVHSKEKRGAFISNKFYPLNILYDKFIPYDRYYLVRKDSKYGLLDFYNFSEILPCEYDEISFELQDANKVIVIKGQEVKKIDLR